MSAVTPILTRRPASAPATSPNMLHPAAPGSHIWGCYPSSESSCASRAASSATADALKEFRTSSTGVGNRGDVGGGPEASRRAPEECTETPDMTLGLDGTSSLACHRGKKQRKTSTSARSRSGKRRTANGTTSTSFGTSTTISDLHRSCRNAQLYCIHTASKRLRDGFYKLTVGTLLTW